MGTKDNKSKSKDKEFVRLVKSFSFTNSGKVVSATNGGILKDAATQDSSDDEIDPVLPAAQQILDLILDDALNVANLTRTQWNYLAYYFFRLNYIVYRSITLKTRIPMSVFQILKPKMDNNDILQDYTYKFFQDNLQEVGFKNKLTQAGYHLNLFGKAYIMIQTNCSQETDTIIDFNELKKGKRDIIISEEDRAFIDKVNKKYNEDINSVSYDEVQKVLNLSVPFMTEFTGITSMSVISPFDVKSESYNDEVNYKEIEIPVSPFILAYIESLDVKDKDTMVEDLVSMGYSKEYVDMNVKAINDGDNTIQVTNDFNNDVYFVELTLDEIGDDATPLTSVFEDLISMEMKRKKDNKIVNSTDKIVKILSSTQATPDELYNLSDDITSAVTNGDYSTVTVNYDLNIDDIEFSLKSQLDGDDMDKNIDGIMAGMGVPESLISGSDTYGSAFIQIQALNVEMQNFVNALIFQIERILFKSMAVKKGFVTFDVFGEPKPLVPRITLYKGSVLSDDYMSLIGDLVDSGKLPSSMLIEGILGLDNEESMQEIKRERQLRSEMGLDEM